MELEERITALVVWGEVLGKEAGNTATGTSFGEAKALAFHYNGWFDAHNIDRALEGIAHMLRRNKLEDWVARYDLTGVPSRSVGIIMAGNLPLVGIQDLISALVLGHKAVLKLSSDDNVLLPAALDLLKNISTELRGMVEIAEGKLSRTDAVLATGSNNTARYFEYYFKSIPHVVRKGRSGLAVLDGTESEDELKALGKDVFMYYGLGCRSISKLLLPTDFDKQKIFEAFFEFGSVIDHKKYANNYNYNRTIYLMNDEEFLDNGFLMLKEEGAIASPVATLHYQTYKNEDELLDLIKGHQDEIQCIVGHGNVAFGKSQMPELWDYADGLDTIEFLSTL